MAIANEGVCVVSEGDLLWEPTKECIDSAPLTRFERWLNETRVLAPTEN